MRRYAPLLLLAACAQLPEPLAEPARTLVVSHRREPWLAALTGADATPGAPTMLHLELLAVRGPQPGGPLQDEAALILANYGEPFRGAAPALGGIGLLSGAAAAAWAAAAATAPPTAVQTLGFALAVVAPGVVTQFAVQGLDLGLYATSGADAIRLAFGNDRRELVIHGKPLTADDRVAVLFVPAPAAAGPALALVLRRQADEPRTLAAAMAELARIPAAPPPQRPTGALPIRHQLELARAAVGGQNRRPALLALAQSLQLPHAGDLLLGADEPLLIAITNHLPAADELVPGPATTWQVERAMLSALVPALQRQTLPVALRATLIRHFGALALDPSALDLLLQTTPDASSFAAGVRAANLDALADHDTAPRLRAHDWLVEHGAAVPDFDPLAPREARQQALRRLAAATAATEPGSTTPEGSR